jgi:hypothetical protein
VKIEENAPVFKKLGRAMTFLLTGLEISLVLSALGCHRNPPPKSTISSNLPAPSLTAALNYSAEISPADDLSYFLDHGQVELKGEGDRILIHSTGDDPNFTIQVSATPAIHYVLAIDIESPIETQLEVFYQIGNSPFSADHALRSPLKVRRNRLVFELDEPDFTGALRIDPGERAADYSLYSVTIYAINPVSFVRRTRSQKELANAFRDVQKSKMEGGKTSARPLWSLRDAADQANIQVLNDAELKPVANGLEISATGPDPSLLLPEFKLGRGVIAKVVIVSPVSTMLQLFYKVGAQIDYDEAHSYTYSIKTGENEVYFEHAQPAAMGQLRFDPGTEPGKYLLKELEFRALPEIGPVAPSRRSRF